MPAKAETETFKVIKDASRPREASNLRTIKMFQPTCAECQMIPTYRWWEDCPHDPYFIKTPRDVTEDVLEEVDGETLITGQKVKRVLDKTPQLAQIALSIRVNSGGGVDNARDRGCVMPEEMGYAPMCQYLNCWKALTGKTVVRSIYGDFCSDMHARLIAADEEEITLDVTDARKRRRQLRQIDIA